MIKYKFLIAVIMAAIIFGVTACGTDDDKKSNEPDYPEYPNNPGDNPGGNGGESNSTKAKLVGKWESSDLGEIWGFQFNSDGTGIGFEDNGRDVWPIEWSYSDNLLYIEFPDEPGEYALAKVVYISDTFLIWTDPKGEGENIKFRKVSKFSWED